MSLGEAISRALEHRVRAERSLLRKILRSSGARSYDGHTLFVEAWIDDLTKHETEALRDIFAVEAWATKKEETDGK